jgi:hypothetical protein
MARLIVLLAVISIVGCTGGSAGPPAEPAAVTQAAAEEAGDSSACRENADCGTEDRYCAKPPGECDGEGECLVRPELCTDDWRPVCGCDGKTYGNPCGAASAGQSVAYDGECREDSSG